MSSVQEQIQRIEKKLTSLVSHYQHLLRENQKLRNEQAALLDAQKNLISKADQLELQIALLKSSETDEAKSSRAALEKKINAYVKEIDKCIAILGNQA